MGELIADQAQLAELPEALDASERANLIVISLEFSKPRQTFQL